MKQIIFMMLCVLFSSTVFAQQKRTCHSMENLEYRKTLDPQLEKRMSQIENFTQQQLKALKGKRTIDGDIITIPVVVHVIYSNSQENISDAQIQSQIDVINEDFRRTNSDANNKWSQAADTQIQFQLATVDPNGNTTTGITRTSSSRTSWGTNDAMKRSSSGGVDPWNTAEYLNMWVCEIGGGILGYAQFPGGSAATDGVVMGPQYFGSSDKGSGFYLSAPFDKGRTTTHEIGHYLNLRHIWGDGGCGVDDFVSDTPTSDGANYGCATGHNSCGSEDMVENYMDYSDDACMNLYTQGQKDRMRAVLEQGGSRRALALSDKFGGGTTPTDPTCDDGIQNGDETGVDCGGSSCQPCQSSCTENGVTVSITFDNYPEETSWTLTDDSGATVASASYSTANADGSTVTEDLCLPDGCYTFTINDAYGDGICCSYGNGSYSVTDASGTLASGGSFTDSEATEVCVGDSTPLPTPTCDDGIQNGDETGIDCGGSSCAPCNSGGDDVLLESYFESGWDGWSDGGNDCSRYSGSRSYEGSYSIFLRDNSGVASSMTSQSLDLTAYGSVQVDFYFYANSMETGEDFWLRYYNGSSWATVAAYASGTNFNNNTFYSGSVTLSSADYSFANNSQFRFQCDASGNGDRIYIDQVTVTGLSSANRASGDHLVALHSLRTSNDLTREEFTLYPNPVSGHILNISLDPYTKATFRIVNTLGQLVKSGQLEQQINISSLKTGVYIFEINDGDEITTQKFLKK